FQDEIVDDPVLAFHNRGRRLEIVTLSEPGFDSYWSGNTTDICPVGALTTADFRFGARPWELNNVSTISVHGPAGSNMSLSTRREAKSGGRMVIKRALPRQNELVNELWISDRDRFVYHFAEAADRLQTPLVRKNGALTPASWEEALDLVAAKLSEHQAAVAGLAGDRLANEDLYLFQKLFRKGLKSSHIDLAQRRLGGGEVVASVGFTSSAEVAPPERLGAGDAILVVASDLHEEEPVWWLRVKQAVERGAKLVVLNLRPTRLDDYATVDIQYQPGEALDKVQQLLAAARVDADSEDPLVAAANLLVEASNLVVFYGYEGLTFTETETLARLLGNLLLVKNGEGHDHYGRANNGLIPVWPHNNTQGAWDMGVHPALLPGYKAAKETGMSATQIYDAVQKGDLHALFVMGADPVGDGLLAGRGALSFLVVQELFLTATAELADVVLPAQSWAERDGTFTSGERRVQRYYPAILPTGESKPDWHILAQIGERLGLGKPPIAAGQIFSEIANAVPQYKSMTYRMLAKAEPQWPIITGHDNYYGGNVVANRSGLGQQWSVAAPASLEPYEIGEQGAATEPAGLKLVRIAALYSPGTLIDHSEVMVPRIARPTLILNSVDAAELGLSEGDHAAIVVNGLDCAAAVAIVDMITPGLALLRGVPYFPGLAEATIEKLIVAEKELVV
ncbi:MAG: molybdopterin oxidoreductase family protein, partial [Candidatus Promineifilaceae bacterium]